MSFIIIQTWQCSIDATVTAEKLCSMLQGLALNYAEGAAERAQKSLTLQALPAYWKLPSHRNLLCGDRFLFYRCFDVFIELVA